MRTVVIRVTVDPGRELTAGDLAERAEHFVAQADHAGMTILATPAGQRRDIQVLMDADDGDRARDAVMALCAKVFDTRPDADAVTFVSRGTDDDVRGVLAGFGIAGDISRSDSGEGYDIVTVRLAAEYLEHIPESRVHTALEAALNAEVRLVVE